MIAAGTGLTLDEIDAAVVEDLFEVTTLEGGSGEFVTLKLSTDGYYTARRLPPVQ